MKKTIIIYHSNTGITQKYAQEIGKYLNRKRMDAFVTSTVVFRDDMLIGADYLFLGCWTNGLMFLLQKPEKSWVEFAAKLPVKSDVKVTLFTTYKILTGSMFKNMSKELKGKFDPPALGLKSRNQFLTEKNKLDIDRFVN